MQKIKRNSGFVWFGKLLENCMITCKLSDTHTTLVGRTRTDDRTFDKTGTRFRRTIFRRTL